MPPDSRPLSADQPNKILIEPRVVDRFAEVRASDPTVARDDDERTWHERR